MKGTIVTTEGNAQVTYPCLMNWTGSPADPDFVVLFTSEDRGVVVAPGKGTSGPVGSTFDDAYMPGFSVFNGTVELSN